MILPGGHEKDTIHFLPQRDLDEPFLFDGVLIGVADDQAVAMPAEHLFNTAGHGREEWIRDVSHHKADEVCAPGLQALRDSVGSVVEVSRRLQDPPHDLCAHVGLAVERQRGGGHGDTGSAGNVANRH